MSRVLVNLSGDGFASGSDTPNIQTNRWSVATDPETQPLPAGNDIVYSVQNNTDGSNEVVGLR